MKAFTKFLMVLLVVGFTWPALAELKIGLIDMSKVFDNYYKTKAAKATLKDYVGELDKQGQTMLDDLKKINDDYKRLLDEANNQGISATEREKAKRQAETKFKDMQEQQQTIEAFKRRADVMVGEKRRVLFEKLIEEIRAVVNREAKTSGCTIVLDSTAETIGGTPMVLFNTGENDLTGSILSQLNTAAPREETTAPKDDKDRKK